MAFTTESIELPAIANPTGPAEFNLPVREFVGYDPKGKYDITGSPIDRTPKEELNQATTDEVVPEAAAPEESVRLAPQVSALARKEQAQRKREQALAQREKALEARLADAEKYSQLKQKIASKDYSDAEALGLTYDEYVQYKLDQQTKTSPEEQRYQNVEKKLSNLERAQEEQTVKEYQQNQALWKQEIAKVVGDNPAYSTIKELGLEHVVLQHVNDSFDEDGIELSAEQAAQQIEDELLKRAEKFASVSKIKQRLAEPPKTLGAPKASPKTITQTMTVTSKAPSKRPFHLLSESEQWEEAARRLQASRQQGR